jgi:hypothetical protein
MTDLTGIIEQGWAAADANTPEPTVAYLHDLLAQHPGAVEPASLSACTESDLMHY